MLLGFGASFATGMHVQYKMDQGATLNAEKHVAVVETKQGQINTQVAVQDQQQQQKIITVTKTIHDQVPVYITKLDDAKCVIGSGFVSVFNAAASLSPLPSGPTQPVDTPTPFTLSDVANATVLNDTTAYQWKARADAWAAWYAASVKNK